MGGVIQSVTDCKICAGGDDTNTAVLKKRISTTAGTDDKESIKILFLDVDGVLNTYDTKKESETTGINKSICERLGKIIEETQCKIVLSSTWRLDEGSKNKLFLEMRQMANIQIYNDLSKPNNVYLGDTDDLDPDFNGNEGAVRTDEIMAKLTDCKLVSNVTHWVAVDDLKLGRNTKREIVPGFEDHFVQTDETKGITQGKMQDIINILS